MTIRVGMQWAFCLTLLAIGTGCLPQLPENTKDSDSPQRSVLFQTPDSTTEVEEGLEGGVWLQVHTGDGRSVGGYLSTNEPDQRTLIILLHGASTFMTDGSLGSARALHDEFAPFFHERGYITWSLVVQECGAPYGQDDVADVVTAVDWLDVIGRNTLGVDRVFILGYSVGGTQALLTARQRKVDGVIDISGLAQPDSIEKNYLLFQLVGALYPDNLAVCQMMSTLNYYGLPGGSNWDYLDSVHHINEFKSPLLVIHGELDPIFGAAGAHALQNRYDELTAQGASVTPMQFLFLPDEGHFPDLTSGDSRERMLSFINGE